ncbi:MTOR-associated protein MEAK7 isoform X3 [Nelusetta ayraudi]|uniref:MTOR-associated protein MEAK7 isoform X3 n=1 Tax=Nelusetta ayraudi TaxID=303726 RepID=UPI003F7044A6
MGNTESVVVQKRLARFRPEERPVVEGVFDKLQAGAGISSGAPGKIVTLEMLKSSMGSLAPDPMVRRVYHCMCGIDSGLAASGKSGSSATCGVGREQMVIFLADSLRGTSEERAPLVMAMSQNGTRLSTTVTCEQVAEFLQDLISAVVQILVHRGRLQGWKPERMGDGSLGIKLLAEQMCSELKPSEQGCCDVSCLEDWIFRVSQVSLYLEMLVAEGLSVSLSGRPAPTLLPPSRETPWKELKCLLDIPILMFLTPQLPDSYSAPWRLVFSTRLHGESFTRMVGGLMKRGPTLLLIKDTKGHIFGGFASHGWEVKPQFQDSEFIQRQDTTSTSCTSTRTSRPCRTDWGWAVSTATLVCGWTVTLAGATAEHGQSAPHTAALSFLGKRTSPWTRWKCGPLENHLNRRRARKGRARKASLTWIQRFRP